jgi:hypothetical protein
MVTTDFLSLMHNANNLDFSNLIFRYDLIPILVSSHLMIKMMLTSCHYTRFLVNLSSTNHQTVRADASACPFVYIQIKSTDTLNFLNIFSIMKTTIMKKMYFRSVNPVAIM